VARDPRKLCLQDANVEVVRGDLADPESLRAAVRDVDVVVHLAAAIRDQPGATIEQVSGTATATLVDAAQEAGVRRFIFFSTLEASAQSPARFFRAKALAEQAVAGAALETIIFAPSIIYAPDDPFIMLLRRLARIPFAMPISGSGTASYQPIWCSDVADCVIAALQWNVAQGNRFELAGPQTLTYEEIVRLVLRSAGRRRALVHLPTPLVYRSLTMLETLAGRRAFATRDEAELMEIPLISTRGTRDAERLGVRPQTMAAVLGLAG
jgi:NADH dehydrogenase